jgi:glutathione-independent formaldehyde dehydrogenase
MPGQAVQRRAARPDHSGRATPSLLVSHELPLDEAPGAYEKFDKRADGYTKVLLHP